MIGFGILAGVLVTIFGVISIVAPEATWAIQRFTNQLGGRPSERTSTWEVGRVFSGIICIAVGIAMIVLFSRV